MSVLNIAFVFVQIYLCSDYHTASFIHCVVKQQTLC